MKKILMVAVCCLSFNCFAQVSHKDVVKAQRQYQQESNPDVKKVDSLTYKGFTAIRHDQHTPSIFKRKK